MNIRNRNIPAFNYFEIDGRLDHDDLVGLQNDIDHQMKYGSKYFLFDISNLEYLSSSGLRTFIKTQKQLKLFDGFLILLSPQKNVETLLNMSELSELLKVKYKFEDAINEFTI